MSFVSHWCNKAAKLKEYKANSGFAAFPCTPLPNNSIDTSNCGCTATIGTPPTLQQRESHQTRLFYVSVYLALRIPRGESAALANSSSLHSSQPSQSQPIQASSLSFSGLLTAKPQTQQNHFLSLPAICDPSSRTSTPLKSARRKLSASARNTPTAFL